MENFKIKFKLGDVVSFNTVIGKHYDHSTGTNVLSQREIKMETSLIGIIVGYRRIPNGTVVNRQFRTDGFERVYLVSTNIRNKHHRVPVNNAVLIKKNNIIPKDLQNNTYITSPYENELLEIKSTRKFTKFGYILRKEVINDSDSIMLKVCYSMDGKYIGNNDTATLLCRKLGIRQFEYTPNNQSVCSIGFNPEEQKWYGWSHRAVYGFGIGSSISKGDCAYLPANKEDMLRSVSDFWDIGIKQECETADKHSVKTLERFKFDHVCPDSSRIGLQIVVRTTFDFDRKDYTSTFFDEYPREWKGEWTAKTLDDAKQMAIDFANGVD